MFDHLEMVKAKGFGLDPMGIIGMVVYWGEGPEDYFTYVRQCEEGCYARLIKNPERWLDKIIKALSDIGEPHEDKEDIDHINNLEELINSRLEWLSRACTDGVLGRQICRDEYMSIHGMKKALYHMIKNELKLKYESVPPDEMTKLIDRINDLNLADECYDWIFNRGRFGNNSH